MKAYRLKWKQRNRTWEFADGPLIGDSIVFGFDRIIIKLLRNIGAVQARRALRDGCLMIISDQYKDELLPFICKRRDGRGALYHNDEAGSGWLDCKSLLGSCPDMLYIGVSL